MTEHHPIAQSEVLFHPEHASNTKRIWKIFWVLTFLTIAELVLGYWLYVMHSGTETPSSFLVLFLKGAITILTIAKAYFIVNVFMHLGDEIKTFKMTIVTTLLLFVWFIIAFLADGNAWRVMRNTDAHSRPDMHQKATTHEVPAPKPNTKP